MWTLPRFCVCPQAHLFRCGSWHSWAPGGLANCTQGLAKSYDSQHKNRQPCKMLVKPELHFCTQTNDVSLQLGIISGSPQLCNLKSHPWSGHTTQGLLPIRTPGCCYWGTSQRAGFPMWHSGKKSACHCRRHKRRGLGPWFRMIPWRRKWQPIPVFLSGKFHGKRRLAAYSPRGHKRVRHDWLSTCTRACTHTHTHTTPSMLFKSGCWSAQFGDVCAITLLYWFYFSFLLMAVY